jgi:hypothetical protein
MRAYSTLKVIGRVVGSAVLVYLLCGVVYAGASG